MSLNSWNRGPRYSWRERNAELKDPPSAWPVRIEFALLAGSALLVVGHYLYGWLF